MGDPICRWRNPSKIENVIELIGWIPKFEQSEITARSYIQQSYGNGFFTTPYQLACQLGLYYKKNGYYFPRFTYTPNINELRKYLENWMIHYVTPNPYTPSITEEIKPFSIHSKLCEALLSNGKPIPWFNTLYEIFGPKVGTEEKPIGNEDILRNALNEYSLVLDIRKIAKEPHTISLKDGKTYDDLIPYINVDTCLTGIDSEFFFDLFELKNEIQDSLTLNITDEENDILNALENTDISQTEKYQIAKARVGQGKFRRLLIEEGLYCPFTQVDDFRLLIASHIKPWTVANNLERLDPKNGLLLTPTYDKLFDKGFISFTENKELMISSKLDGNNISKLGLIPNNVVSNLNLEGREQYFAYHRREVFRS